MANILKHIKAGCGSFSASLCALLFVTALALFPADIPDISLSNHAWELDHGVRIENGTLIVEGDSAATRRAKIIVPAEAFGHAPLYLAGEIKLENAALGKNYYHAPKFKIYQSDDLTKYAARNISSGGNTDWSLFALKYQIKKEDRAAALLVEISMQQCTGIFYVRNLVFSLTPPALELNSFPYALPEHLVCSIAIEKNNTKPFNNNLLGANSQFVFDADYSYDSPIIDIAVKDSGITLLRFPGGTVANWYDWETDKYFIPPDGPPPKFGIRDKAFRYRAYETLCKNNKLSTIQVFNILYDSPEKSAQRLRSLIRDGMRPSWIELGNENENRDQQSTEIYTAEAYIKKTKSVVDALKMVDPSIKCAVNIQHGNLAENEWAVALAQNRYFDAVVMHPYALKGGSAFDTETMRGILKAYMTVKEYIDDYRTIFMRTPLLISEWGCPAVSKKIVQGNHITALGTADAFFAIIENADDNLVEMASLHIFFGDFMGMYYVDADRRLVKRGYAIVFRMISSVFKDSELFTARSRSPELVAGLPAIQARASRSRDGIIRVFTVNKCPQKAALVIEIDGVPYAGAWSIESFSETDITDHREYAINENPVKKSQGSGAITLAEYSINIVTLK